MRDNTLILTTAVLALLALSACNKPNAAADSANKAAASGAPAVAGAEDATAGAVGAVAATAGALTTSGFVTGAATSDMYEVAAGKIAKQKSVSPAVKAFAAKMIHDHTATTLAVKKILAGGVAATPPADMDKRRKGLINNLTLAAPGDFDKTYMDQQIAAHDEALTLFHGFADHGDNDALKAFAATTAPKIQAHRDMAKQIRDAMK